MVDAARLKSFQRTVMAYYQEYGRHDLPWRQPAADGSFDPYKILVSEIMLQQTQVQRVIPKYHDFLERFPTVQQLATAPLADVLRAWSGLGYNRRAKFLHEAAQMISQQSDGQFASDISSLVKLPGVGHNTAAAILAYANDKPVSFIETNIRTVFIHHFFNDQQTVSDEAIMEMVTTTLPKTGARLWYWALMDYGAHLKQTVGNLNQASKTYTKQASFEGSRRQLRGRVIHLLGTGQYSADQLMAKLADQRLDEVLHDLVEEGMIRQQGQQFSL